MPKTPRKPKFRTLLRLDEQKRLQKKKTKACSLHPVPPAVLRYSGWALFLKMRLFQSLNQAQFHLDHWVANIVSGRRRSHSSWTLTHTPVVSLTISQVAHTWPFNCPKPESIFSLQLLVFRSVLQGRGGSAGPSLALSGEQSACVQWHSRWNEKKHETRSKCAVRAQRRFFFFLFYFHTACGYFLLGQDNGAMPGRSACEKTDKMCWRALWGELHCWLSSFVFSQLARRTNVYSSLQSR